MLHDIIDVLADPADGSALSGRDDFTRLVSETGHSYDVAKQGYVTLVSGAGLKHSGDDAEMVAARETFLSQGHFAPLVEAVTGAIAEAINDADRDSASGTQSEQPVIVETGAGTGYYLSHTLDSIEGTRGVGIDISTPAAKHLAKCHPRAGAVVADVWSQLPLKAGSADIISVVFAPRNPAEFHRVLKDHGQVVVLTPEIGHLDELREPLGILGVEPSKVERMYEQAKGYLRPAAEPETISFRMRLDKGSIKAQIGMSPSARHFDAEELAARMEALPETMTVTARARLDRFAKA